MAACDVDLPLGMQRQHRIAGNCPSCSARYERTDICIHTYILYISAHQGGWTYLYILILFSHYRAVKSGLENDSFVVEAVSCTYQLDSVVLRGRASVRQTSSAQVLLQISAAGHQLLGIVISLALRPSDSTFLSL